MREDFLALVLSCCLSRLLSFFRSSLTSESLEEANNFMEMSLTDKPMNVQEKLISI